jgi:predicted RecB family nuclease
VSDKKLFSPTALTRFFESEFCSYMDQFEKLASDQIKKELGVHRNPPDPLLDLLAKMGNEHEANQLKVLKKQKNVVVIKEESMEKAFEATKGVMKDGAEVIYQAALTNDSFRGYADVLIRVPGKSKLGDFFYEPHDMKIASSPKPSALLQLCCYAELLLGVQGVLPESFYVITKDGQSHKFKTKTFWSFYLLLRSTFLDFQKTLDLENIPLPEKMADHRNWSIFARRTMYRADDVALTARIRSSHIEILRSHAKVKTITELSKFIETKLPGIPADTLATLKSQAELQVQSRGEDKPAFLVLPHDDERSGLQMLPPLDKADIYFDMEGSFLIGENGLEYLYGNVTENEKKYIPFWAKSPGEEAKAFSGWVEWAYDRWKKNPNMHVYHYGHYEPSTLKRLMGQYGIKENEIDNFLRNNVFVDLSRIVVQSLRIGTPSYSLKEVEKLYYPKRETAVSSGNDAAVQFHHYMTCDDEKEMNKFLDEIEKYNLDDCRSTMDLTHFLRKIQRAKGIEYVPLAEEIVVQNERSGVRGECEAKSRELLGKIPSEERGLSLTEANESNYLSELLAHLLEFHIREDKPEWWDYFKRFDMDLEEKFEDPYTIANCQLVSKVGNKWQVKFETAQEIRFDVDDKVNLLECENAKLNFEVLDIDLVEGRATLLAPKSIEPPVDTFTLVPEKNDFYKVNLFKSILKTANEFSPKAKNSGLRKCVFDLLTRARPDIKGHKGDLIPSNDGLVDRACDHALNLNSSILCIQGPPGSGKTYTGAKMILALVRAGKKVGVTANSHRAIINLIKKVCELLPPDDKIKIQKVTRAENIADEQQILKACPVGVVDNNKVRFGPGVIGGTTFFFAREASENQLDYLFVDEASQVSLANIVAAARSTQNLVLLGDQNQLDQPIKGAHPGESSKSALSYYTDGQTTIAGDQGIFLPVTRRMHPEICKFISENFYDGRLSHHGDTEKGKILFGAKTELPETGMHFVPVDHLGNAHSSSEEVEVINELFQKLLGSKWVDKGVEKKITPEDILIVSPYNLQVALLKKSLGDTAKVGTVDKFQGQEAPVCIVSMAASTIADAPRGLSFLFNKNRLNVAISRAKCLSIVVGSKRLLTTKVSSAEGMELMNVWCGVVGLGR